MQLTEQWISCTLLLTLAAALLTGGAKGSAQLYDFGIMASDGQLNNADDLYMQVNLTDSLTYLGGAEKEIFVSTISTIYIIYNYNEVNSSTLYFLCCLANILCSTIVSCRDQY